MNPLRPPYFCTGGINNATIIPTLTLEQKCFVPAVRSRCMRMRSARFYSWFAHFSSDFFSTFRSFILEHKSLLKNHPFNFCVNISMFTPSNMRNFDFASFLEIRFCKLPKNEIHWSDDKTVTITLSLRGRTNKNEYGSHCCYNSSKFQ